MIRSILKIACCVAVGAASTLVPWSDLSSSVRGWFTEPSVGTFEKVFVSDMNTVYTFAELEEIGGKIDDAGQLSGNPVCPNTGSTSFRETIGRVVYDFWGDKIGFQPAEEVQLKLKIEAARGDVDWDKFIGAVKELRVEDETVAAPSVPEKSEF